MIVPRHVLGRGFQAPSDLVNVAVVGINGMGAENARGVMSQNIVAICDCDFGLLDGKLAQWTRQAQAAPRSAAQAPPAPAGTASNPFQVLGPSKGQLAADAKWPAQDDAVNLRSFVEKQIPRLQKYRDYREMLEKQKDLDAIIVATPDHMHAVIASNAMDAGKHVYVQKPLCWSVHEARHLQKKAAEKTKVVTQMGNQRHSNDEQRRGVEYIMAGAIGEVREVHVWTNRPYGFWPQGVPRPAALTGDPARVGWDNRGLTQRIAAAMDGTYPVPPGLSWDLFLGVAPEVPYHPIYHPFNWRGWVDWGQGALGDMGAHLIDFPMWALKLGLPTVIETEATPFNGATYPSATTTYYEFPKRDGLPEVKLMWYDGGPHAVRSAGARRGEAEPRRRHPVRGQEGQAAPGKRRAAPAAAGLPSQRVRRAEGAARTHRARRSRDELDQHDQRQGPDLVSVRVRGAPHGNDAPRDRVAPGQLEAALRRGGDARDEQPGGRPVPDAPVSQGMDALAGR